MTPEEIKALVPELKEWREAGLTVTDDQAFAWDDLNSLLAAERKAHAETKAELELLKPVVEATLGYVESSKAWTHTLRTKEESHIGHVVNNIQAFKRLQTAINQFKKG